MEVKYQSVSLDLLPDISRRSTLKEIYKTGKTLDRSIELMVHGGVRIDRGKMLVFVGGRASILEQLRKGGPRLLYMDSSNRFITVIGVRATSKVRTDYTGLCFGDLAPGQVPPEVKRFQRSTPLEKEALLKTVAEVFEQFAD